MDLGNADAHGVPLAWSSPIGNVSADRYEPEGAGWLRTFAGGLLSTCGLRSTGAPSSEAGAEHGLHGRIGNIPAQQVSWDVLLDAQEPRIEIRGRVVEAAYGEPTLSMDRRITISCTEPSVSVTDRVTNESFVTATHMFRHHLNLGYPIVDDGTCVDGDLTFVGCRDHPAEDSPSSVLAADVPGPEHVWYFRPNTGSSVVTVQGPSGVGAAEVSWDGPEFDRLIVWRDASPGVNVLGVEPSMSWDDGRAATAAEGDLRELQPGESALYRTSFRYLPPEPTAQIWIRKE